MKNILIALLIYSSAMGLAEADECTETTKSITQDVVHAVNKDMPKHLQGATITVKLADGSETTVPAEKFMVVPRKQYTVAGQNKTVSSKLTCDKDQKKNIVYVGAKRELTDLETKVNVPAKSAQVDSLKVLTPSINYMRRKILDSDLNLGGGVDKNGQVQGTIGLDF
jgi:hypothetical protein